MQYPLPYYGQTKEQAKMEILKGGEKEGLNKVVWRGGH